METSTNPDSEPRLDGEAPAMAASRWPQRALDPVRGWRRYGWIGVVVAMLIGGLGLAVAWFKGAPVYYAEAAVRVSRTFAKNLQTDDELTFNSNSDYRQFVQQQVREITSYAIAREALEAIETEHVEWRREEESPRRAAERLQAALQVRAVPDTYLITIGLESDSPDGVAHIVNTIVATYLARQKQQEIEDPSLRLAQLGARRGEMVAHIAESSERLAEIAQELGVTSFEEKFLNPYDSILKNGADALAAARRKRIEAEAALAALEEHLERIAGMGVDAGALRLLGSDLGVSSTKSFMAERRSELVLRLAKLADGHPGRAAVVGEIAEIDRELERVTKSALASFRSMLREERRSELETELSEARARAGEAQHVEAELENEVAVQRENVAWFSRRYSEALDVQALLAQERERLGAIDDRVDFITLETEAPGFLRVASEARDPIIPVRGGRRKLFALFVLAALVVGAAVPVAVERIDPRIHTAEELASVLAFRPTGWLVENGAAPVAGDRLNRLALAIDSEAARQSTRVFGLLGATADGDARELSASLSTALRRMGRTVHVVSVHDGCVELCPANAGVTHPPALQGLCSVADLRAFLETCTQEGATVLVATDHLDSGVHAELVARACDAVLLVVHAARDRARDVRLAANALAAIGPATVGAVLVGVDAARVAAPGSSTDDGDARVRAASEVSRLPGLLRA